MTSLTREKLEDQLAWADSQALLAHNDTEFAVTALKGWIADAMKKIEGGKASAAETAKLGDLLINACAFLTSREVARNTAITEQRHRLRKWPDVSVIPPIAFP